MNHALPFKELLFVQEGPPEGVWQAALHFATSSDQSPDEHLMVGLTPDNSPAPEADPTMNRADSSEAEEEDDSMPADGMQGDDYELSSHRSSERTDADYISGDRDGAGDDGG